MINQPTILATIWSLFVVSLLTFGFRVYVHNTIFKRLSHNDFFALLALLFALGNAFITTEILPRLFSLSRADTNPQASNSDDITYVSTHQIVLFVLSVSCLWAVKASFLAIYYSLIDDAKYLRYAWFAIVSMTILAYLGALSSYLILSTACVQGEFIENLGVASTYTL